MLNMSKALPLDIFQINGKHISLKSETNQLPTNSVPTPSALSETQCDGHKSQDLLNEAVQTSMRSLKNLSPALYCIAHLLFANGLRISEVLQISPGDISSAGFVKIRGSKGSEDRVIHSGDACDYLLKCRKLSVFPFEGISRFHVYREFKKVGLSHRFGDNKRKSVTHIFRHMASLNAKSVNADLDTRARQLGHKSTKSTEYYGKS